MFIDNNFPNLKGTYNTTKLVNDESQVPGMVPGSRWALASKCGTE